MDKNKAVPKHDRLFEPTDVLGMCGYVKVTDIDALDGAKICESAAKMVLSLFYHIDVLGWEIHPEFCGI